MPRSGTKLLALAIAVSAVAFSAVTVEKVNCQGWPNCYRISNGEIEVVVTGDVGPRIMRFAFTGGRNLFKEYTEQLGKSGEKEFQLRGGGRVWKAPEDPVATWAPDNSPVSTDLGDAYLLNGDLFVKRYEAAPARQYTDFGCSFEMFTNAEFLEIETLGPLTKVPPKGLVEHIEDWSLHRNICVSAFTDAELDRVILPLLK